MRPRTFPVHMLCGLLLVASATVVSALVQSNPEGSRSSPGQSEPPTISVDKLTTPIRRSPQKGSDGICHTYVVQGPDTCASIAQAFGITEKDIETFNADTFSWKGCDKMYQGIFICLSSGAPPMPMAFEGATCGPQVPGTIRPSNIADIDSLNPCPSGKCCNLEEALCADVCAPRMVPSNEGGITHLVAYTKTAAPPAATEQAPSKTTAVDQVAEKTKTASSPRPDATWRLVAHTAPWCGYGNYYIQGASQAPGECTNFEEGLSTEWDGKFSCRHYAEEGTNSTWTPCDSVQHATSWRIENAFCTVYRERDCKDNGKGSHIISSADESGCSNASRKIAKKLKKWGSIHCSVFSLL